MAGSSIGDGGPRGLPLCLAYRAGDYVFVTGQVGFGPDGALVAGGIEAETRQTLDNIAAALSAAGASLADVAKASVFLADLGDFDAFNAVYRSYFRDAPPARTTVGAQLMIGARVEIEAVAYAPLAKSGSSDTGWPRT
jgi:2-iminobutanoate/2-iminopropanoate deaminase